MAHTSYMLDKQGYMHAHACARRHKNVIFIAFPRQQWFAKGPQCYVIRTLSVQLHTGAGRAQSGYWVHYALENQGTEVLFPVRAIIFFSSPKRTQSPIQWTPNVVSPSQSGRVVNLTTRVGYKWLELYLHSAYIPSQREHGQLYFSHKFV